jgi:aspartate 1-decarboxylase
MSALALVGGNPSSGVRTDPQDWVRRPAKLCGAGIREFQHVEICNVENGERLTTYAIKAPAGGGEICLNGAAARKAMVGDHLIICAYSTYSPADLAEYRPVVVLVDDNYRPLP